MIPEKGKTYEINYMPYDPDLIETQYTGLGIYLGETVDGEEEGQVLYNFKCNDDNILHALFSEEDIIRESNLTCTEWYDSVLGKGETWIMKWQMIDFGN